MSNNCKDERLKPPAPKAAPLDLATVREKLSQAKGKRYWRSLEELAETEEFKEMLHREFPRHASEWSDGVSRRNFMQLMGASLALAGLSACTKQPVENIVPYVPAGRDYPGQASLFCHLHAAGRCYAAGPGQERYGPPYQSGWQSGSSCRQFGQ